MWVIVMFDLPTGSADERKCYAQFRKFLLKDGFTMMQYSVYARHCASEDNAAVHAMRVEGALPPDGEVRLLRITDKQFERMQVFWARKRKPPEQAGVQLQLF